MHTSSDTGLEWPREGHYASGTEINAGDSKQGHYSSTSWAIIEVRPAALGQIWHPPGSHKQET